MTHLTSVEAISSWLVVKASHSIGSPLDDGTAMSTPRLHNSSTTMFCPLIVASSKGV